jgi:hypothetical protein
MKKIKYFILVVMILATAVSRSQVSARPKGGLPSDERLQAKKLNESPVVKLTTDTTKLTANEKLMIPLLIKVAKIMDEIFWEQVVGSRKQIISEAPNKTVQRLLLINYGPWERFNGNRPFDRKYGPKPKGVNFYPQDMTKEEFEQFSDKLKTSPYTLIQRNEDKSLRCVWFHDAYREKIEQAVGFLIQAADLAEDPGLKLYLQYRAKALLSDDYFASDMAWMDMKTNTIDFIVGPIENYEDELYGYKTAYEAAILIKDKDWSKKLEKFAKYLPELQNQLPVDPKYKKEVPAKGSDLNAYDIIYAAGHANAGAKTIAINLPNDEKVQEEKGSRRLQLKNVIQAKFDRILVPISNVLIDTFERKHVRFDAFFSNVMFHEVAHGLGIKNTITGKGTVREALKEKYSAFEEAKADILGLFLVTKLIEKGEIKNITETDCFVTFMAGIIRSVRFGAADAHGKANMMCFNYFQDKGAFERTDKGTYKVNTEKFRQAMNAWASKVLIFEGDGDYKGASEYLEENGIIRTSLQTDLNRLRTARIPVDILYEQGTKVLGLK